MHRMISVRHLYQNGFHTFILPSNNSLANSNTEIKCSFCRKILLGRPNLDLQFVTRHQSTKTDTAHQSQKKKPKHKNYKKYGELLEVGEQAMTETKVSIRKLKAKHLSKLAAGPVSLGQLHQLTKNTKQTAIQAPDPEVLQSIKENLLKNSSPVVAREIDLEDDQCALVYTQHPTSKFEDQYKTKVFIDSVKESYYNFRKASLLDQRLQDLRYAINEGLTQEFDLDGQKVDPKAEEWSIPRSPHAVFRELFVDNQLDGYDQELISHLYNVQSQSQTHPMHDDGMYNEHNEIADGTEDIDHDHDLENEHVTSLQIKTLKVKKAKQEIRRKRKVTLAKRRAKEEENMKEHMSDIEQRGKQVAFDKKVEAHIQLLCALNMTNEARQLVQYFRLRGSNLADKPKVTSVKVYNTILHGHAAVGDFETIKKLLSMMHKDAISLNPQSYAAVFECIERCQLQNKETSLSFYHREMQEKGISLNDLLDKSKFLHNQRETTLRAIRRISPNFEPQYTPPKLDYACTLLDKLTLDKKENRTGLYLSPVDGLITQEEMKEKIMEQFAIEIKGDVEIQNIDSVKAEESKSVKFYREKLESTKKEWREVIKAAFIRNLGTLKSQCKASNTPITLYPYLKVLEVDQFVDLIMADMSKLVDGSESYSPTLSLLQRNIGTQVFYQYQIANYRQNGVLDKFTEVYNKYCEWFLKRPDLDGGTTPYNCRQAWQIIEHRCRTGASLDLDETPWPMEMRQNIGRFLYNIITNELKININMFKTKAAKEKKMPAVYKVHRQWGRLVRLELKPHPCVARLWSVARPSTLHMRAALVPRAAPPSPWHRVYAGSTDLTHTSLIRMPFQVINQWKRLEEAPLNTLYPLFDSLNQLSEVPWVVNQPILDLQMEIFRSGGNKKLDIPRPSSSIDTSEIDKAPDAASKFKKRLQINRARAEMHSLWCDSLYKLSLANHFRNKIFWLPHNMDFRGRVYATPPHLSQLGADASRAMLVFAKKLPLGPHGLDWLKLHVINLTGTMKKNTIAQRLEHANKILDTILDSADYPLEGKRWWMESEDPWQTLACCKEISKAVRSPNPEEYCTGFPVHQDGSCNGLQHYAALGGDSAGARAVNLAPEPCPRDVYSTVANMVEEMRIRDAKAGNPEAIVLENYVRRKVIKQTVMTTVYGVTRFGARLQIAKQLKDIEEFPKEHVWACSNYLTARTFESLSRMFSSTKLIQDWLTDCAKLISGVCGSSVEWTTPLGLPVVQPYYRRSITKIPVDHHQRPCTMKQRNAFPPNFIHSLDSSHMMLTSLYCQAAGITFVSVHDCFWTHPHTVPIMNKICREQFVALHSQPILKDLSEFLMKLYSYPECDILNNTPGGTAKKRVNTFLSKVPSKGDFDLKSVLDSVYFFS